ncbi:MAG: DNA cytosine methyltransferase [Rhizobacter sp.]|nr:DNA cytosine methyltransferase [Rhizobacter sp.]
MKNHEHMTHKSNHETGAARPAVSGRQLTYVDLFAGCGGFSLGLEWAGLRCLAAIDFNESAIDTFKLNHPDVAHALVKDCWRQPKIEPL